MPVLPLKVDYQGGQAEKGLRGLQGMAGTLTKALGAVGVAFAVGGIVKGLSDMYVGFEKDVQTADKLERTITKLNGTTAQRERALKLVDFAVTKLGKDEDETALALSRMITKTGDAQLGLDSFNIAQDLAAKLGMDLAGAVDLTAKVVTGQYTVVGKALPFMKTWISTHKELIGTVEGAAQATEILRKAVAGEAEAMSDSATGQMGRLKNLFGEMKDEMGRILTGSKDTKGAWKEAANSAEEFLRALQKIDGLPVIQTLLKAGTGAANFFGGGADPKVQVGGMPMRQSTLDTYNRAYPGGFAQGKKFGGYLFPEINVSAEDGTDAYTDADWAGPRMLARGKKKKKKKKGQRTAPYTGADWSGPEWFDAGNTTWGMDITRGTFPDYGNDPMPGFMASVSQSDEVAKKEAELLAKQTAEWKAAIADRTAFAEQMFMGFFGNVRNGWDAMLQSMEQSIISFFAKIASERAAKWLIGAISGTGPVGSAVGGLVLAGNPDAGLGKSFGSNTAVALNYARRARRG